MEADVRLFQPELSFVTSTFTGTHNSGGKQSTNVTDADINLNMVHISAFNNDNDMVDKDEEENIVGTFEEASVEKREYKNVKDENESENKVKTFESDSIEKPENTNGKDSDEEEYKVGVEEDSVGESETPDGKGSANLLPGKLTIPVYLDSRDVLREVSGNESDTITYTADQDEEDEGDEEEVDTTAEANGTTFKLGLLNDDKSGFKGDSNNWLKQLVETGFSAYSDRNVVTNSDGGFGIELEDEDMDGHESDTCDMADKFKVLENMIDELNNPKDDSTLAVKRMADNPEGESNIAVKRSVKQTLSIDEVNSQEDALKGNDHIDVKRNNDIVVNRFRQATLSVDDLSSQKDESKRNNETTVNRIGQDILCKDELNNLQDDFKGNNNMVVNRIDQHTLRLDEVNQKDISKKNFDKVMVKRNHKDILNVNGLNEPKCDSDVNDGMPIHRIDQSTFKEYSMEMKKTGTKALNRSNDIADRSNDKGTSRKRGIKLKESGIESANMAFIGIGHHSLRKRKVEINDALNKDNIRLVPEILRKRGMGLKVPDSETAVTNNGIADFRNEQWMSGNSSMDFDKSLRETTNRNNDVEINRKSDLFTHKQCGVESNEDDTARKKICQPERTNEGTFKGQCTDIRGLHKEEIELGGTKNTKLDVEKFRSNDTALVYETDKKSTTMTNNVYSSNSETATVNESCMTDKEVLGLSETKQLYTADKEVSGVSETNHSKQIDQETDTFERTKGTDMGFASADQTTTKEFCVYNTSRKRKQSRPMCYSEEISDSDNEHQDEMDNIETADDNNVEPIDGLVIKSSTGITRRPLCAKLCGSKKRRIYSYGIEIKMSLCREDVIDIINNSLKNVPCLTNRYRRHFLKQLNKTDINCISENGQPVESKDMEETSKSSIEELDSTAVGEIRNPSDNDDNNEVDSTNEMNDDIILEGKTLTLEEMTGNLDGPLACKKCSKHFTTFGTLTAHYVSHAALENEAVYVCKGSITDDLAAESGNIDDTENVFSEMTDKERSVDDMDIDNDDVESSVSDDDESIASSYVDSEQSSGKEKLGTNILESSTYFCHVCQQRFTNITALQSHMTEHSNADGEASGDAKGDNYCTICQKKFASAGSLHVHNKIHTGDNPYTCPTCNKSFRDKTRLTTHIRVHTGEKPFICSVCEKSFSQKGNLKLHQKIHTGERNCLCGVCGNGFRSRSDLVRHMKVHGASLMSNSENDDNSTKASPPVSMKPGLRAQHEAQDAQSKLQGQRSNKIKDLLEANENITPIMTLQGIKSFNDLHAIGRNESHDLLVPHGNRNNFGMPPAFKADLYKGLDARASMLTRPKFAEYDASTYLMNLNKEVEFIKAMTDAKLRSESNPVKGYSCPLCGLVLSSFDTFNHHVLLQHNPLTTFGPPAGTPTKHPAILSLIDPFMSLPKNDKYSCKDCNEVFSSYENLTAHVKTHKQKKVVDASSSLHAKTHRSLSIHGDDFKKFQQQIINEEYNRSRNYRQRYLEELEAASKSHRHASSHLDDLMFHPKQNRLANMDDFSAYTKLHRLAHSDESNAHHKTNKSTHSDSFSAHTKPNKSAHSDSFSAHDKANKFTHSASVHRKSQGSSHSDIHPKPNKSTHSASSSHHRKPCGPSNVNDYGILSKPNNSTHSDRFSSPQSKPNKSTNSDENQKRSQRTTNSAEGHCESDHHIKPYKPTHSAELHAHSVHTRSHRSTNSAVENKPYTPLDGEHTAINTRSGRSTNSANLHHSEHPCKPDPTDGFSEGLFGNILSGRNRKEGDVSQKDTTILDREKDTNLCMAKPERSARNSDISKDHTSIYGPMDIEETLDPQSPDSDPKGPILSRDNGVGSLLCSSSVIEDLKLSSSDKLYSCDFCGKTFRRSHHLQTHMRTHTGDRPYTCLECNKCFARGDHLQNHRRTHTGEKPYTCGICEKSYSQSHHLLRHKRTHTGERPYHCGQCDKTFSRDHHLKKHLETHLLTDPTDGGTSPTRGDLIPRLPSVPSFNMVTRSSNRISQLMLGEVQAENSASKLMESMIKQHLLEEEERKVLKPPEDVDESMDTKESEIKQKNKQEALRITDLLNDEIDKRISSQINADLILDHVMMLARQPKTSVSGVPESGTLLLDSQMSFHNMERRDKIYDKLASAGRFPGSMEFGQDSRQLFQESFRPVSSKIHEEPVKTDLTELLKDGRDTLRNSSDKLQRDMFRGVPVPNELKMDRPGDFRREAARSDLAELLKESREMFRTGPERPQQETFGRKLAELKRDSAKVADKSKSEPELFREMKDLTRVGPDTLLRERLQPWSSETNNMFWAGFTEMGGKGASDETFRAGSGDLLRERLIAESWELGREMLEKCKSESRKAMLTNRNNFDDLTVKAGEMKSGLVKGKLEPGTGISKTLNLESDKARLRSEKGISKTFNLESDKVRLGPGPSVSKMQNIESDKEKVGPALGILKALNFESDKVRIGPDAGIPKTLEDIVNRSLLEEYSLHN